MPGHTVQTPLIVVPPNVRSFLYIVHSDYRPYIQYDGQCDSHWQVKGKIPNAAL